MELVANGELLQYDFPTRRIILQGSSNAVLAFRRHVAESPRLEYELPDDPKRLGKLWATGPGVYRGVLGQHEDPLQARWQGTLELQPQGDLHVLSVVEGADFRSENFGTFSADKLFVWLQEVPLPAGEQSVSGVQQASYNSPQQPPPLTDPTVNLPAEPMATPATTNTAATKQKYEVVPVKMLAQGHVRRTRNNFKVTPRSWKSGLTSRMGKRQRLREPTNQRPQTEAPPPSPGAAGSLLGQPPGESNDDKKRLELSGTQVRVRSPDVQTETDGQRSHGTGKRTADTVANHCR